MSKLTQAVVIRHHDCDVLDISPHTEPQTTVTEYP